MSSYHPRKNIEAVCLVDIDDKKLSEVLKDHYGCKIIPRNDKESYPNKDLVYIFAHFDTIEFQELLDSFIISSTLVWNMYRKNLPLPFPRPKRPLYCEKLSNFNFILRASNEGERVSWCTIVRYMGGHVKREPSATTNFLITDQAKGKAFRQCVSLGQKVLLSSWLHECWEHKDDFDFDPFSVEMINKHRIGVFERLKIFVYGFDDTEDDDIKQNIIRNRGKIVDDVSDATHCVINTSKDLNQLPQLDNQRLVTNEWVWTSINIENCANEESYHPGAPFSQNFTSGPSLSAVTTTDRSVSEGANSVYEAGVGDKTHKTSKAFQVCLEIYETEVSYLNALKLLVGVKEELDLLLDEGVVLLHKSEVSLIFGKILPIMTVHQGIIARLKVILDNWKSDADVAQVWIDSFDDLNRVYAPYSNTHDTAVDALGAADKANPRVHAFLRAKECSKDFKRNTFKDLLIRPVQRIPTLIVLLKELEKRSERKSEKVKEAIMLMDKVVSRANDVRAQNDDFIEQFSFFNEVEGVPPHVVCSRRKMLMSVEANSICGTLEWHNLNRRKVKIILYNDMIMVCKVRSTSDRPGTLNRLTKRTSFSNLNDQRKQFKYFAHLLIPHVREINRLKLLHYEGTVDDRLEPDMLPIYSWTIRDISSDACWYIEAVNKEQMIDFVDEIHKKIFMDFGREVTWHGFVVNDVASTSIRDILVKHIKKSLPKDDALYELPVVDRPSAFSTLRRRSASGLRRTVSHMGNITRRSIPSAFRSSRTAMNNGGDREASSVQPLSSTTNVNIHGNVLEKATAGLSLTMVEESEQELYTAIEHSNKEN